MCTNVLRISSDNAKMYHMYRSRHINDIHRAAELICKHYVDSRPLYQSALRSKQQRTYCFCLVHPYSMYTHYKGHKLLRTLRVSLIVNNSQNKYVILPG